MLISDLGEQGLLKLIQPYCLPNTIGDDGAILHPPLGCELVVTTDVLVDGVHFSDRTTTPFDVGWRSVAANLSDLAAMGAVPLGITVGLSLPPQLPVVWLEQLYAGMQACLERYGTGIVGGDLTRSSIITVAITALGSVTADRIIARSTARVGDSIVVTGYHGDAHAGLQLLLDPQLGQDAADLQNRESLNLRPNNFAVNSLEKVLYLGKPQDRTFRCQLSTVNCLKVHRRRLITAHQRPQPRLDVIPILDELRSGASEIFPISGMDSSDGLADAIDQICRSSQVGAILTRSSLPISPSLAQMFPDTAVASALYGGEDFELVLCMPESVAQTLVDRIGKGAAIIGTITRPPDIILVDDREQYPTIEIDRQSGFQHFE